MKTSASKPTQIKPWPEIVGLLPLLKAADLLPRQKTGKIHLDLTNVHKVDSIGLAIFLARLVQMMTTNTAPLFISEPRTKVVQAGLDALSFTSHLEALGLSHQPERSLFDEFPEEVGTDCISDALPILSWHGYGEIITILPETNGRETVLAQVKQKIKNFLKKDSARNFAHEQIMIILLELVKNTIDHSKKPAILGLHINSQIGLEEKFSFVYCDTGEGICHSVRKHIHEMKMIRLAAKGGFTDLIHWALQPGNSTKSGNGVNFGLGLMLILEASKNCGIRLSVKDADTLMVLTELSSSRSFDSAHMISSQYTHAHIRQLVVKTSTAPLLMFHGELEVPNDVKK